MARVSLLTVIVLIVSVACGSLWAAENLSELYAKGFELQKQGKLQEALVEYNRCLMLAPDDYKALLAVGTVYYTLQEYSKAAKQYETLLIFYPGDLKARLYLAWCKLNLGQVEEAKNTLELYHAEQPNDVSAMIGLGWAEYLSGNIFTAIDRLKKALALQPDNRSLALGVDRLERLGQENLRAQEQEKRFRMMSDLNNAIAEASVARSIALAGETGPPAASNMTPTQKMALFDLWEFSDDYPGKKVLPLPFSAPPLTPPGLPRP